MGEESSVQNEDQKPRPASRETWMARIFLVLYAVLLTTLAAVGFYVLFYVVFLISFLALVVLVHKLNSFDILNSFEFRNKMLIVFVIALATRLVMLFQNQIITDDILNYVYRGQAMLDGKIPYVDFYGGSKPPLHNLILLAISGAFGAGETQFRVVFSVIDAFIAVLILFFSESNRGNKSLLSAALLYAICPISIITIGLSGHFDPVPAIAVVGSTIFLISKRFRSSSIFLGLGLALKIFAAVLLPYYAWKARILKERVLYVVLFAVPMGVSLLGLYLLSPVGPSDYLSETSGWGGWWSFSHLFSVMIGSKTLGPLKVSWIFMGIFLLLILIMYVTIWLKEEEEEKQILFWYKVTVFISIGYLGFMILDGWAQAPPGTDMAPYLAVYAVFFIVAGYAIVRYWKIIFPRRLSGGRTERILIVTSLAIILFCFGLPNYAPWYIIWFLPFLLAVRTDEVRLTLIFLLVWHIMGKGVSILPGMSPIN